MSVTLCDSTSCLFLYFFCSYVFICIFFFKQKTAYEMRISDWSSDVCLPILPRSVSGTSTKLSDFSISWAFRNGGGRITRKDASRSSSLQIGRASCRERVCQYE